MIKNNQFRQNSRIIWAIAAKDIIDAFKNRTLLTITLGVMLLMLTGPALSLFVNRNRPNLVIYAPSGLAIFQSLEQQSDLRLILVDSQKQMNSFILQPSQTIIGVILPAIEGSIPDNGLILQGFTAHWASQSQLRERLAFFEAALSSASGKSVHIDIDAHRLYPTEADSYQFTMISLSMMTMILLMGLALVPYLFIEEKESHTLDALLVSPAHYWQVVMGKLIAGAVYCLIAAAIVLLFNFRLVVHWELMLVGIVLGAAFTVAIGLLLGVLIENTASMGLWTGLFTIVLLISPLLHTMGSGKIPAAIQSIFSWLPSTAIFGLVISAMLGELQVDQIWQGILLLAGTTLVLCLLVIWRIRQMDR